MVCAIRKARVLSILFVVVLLAVAEIAEAQQPKKVPRIGFVAMTSSAGGGQNLEAFRRGLRDLGYVEGDNISMEPRWADGWAERVPGLISELIHLKVDIIVISSATGALAAKKATSTIPVVFAAVTDPFEHGLIVSLARPGGNVTGASLAVGEGFSGKWASCSRRPCRRLQVSRCFGTPLIPWRACSREKPSWRPKHSGSVCGFLRSAIPSSSIRRLQISRKSTQPRSWSPPIPSFSIKES